MNKYIKPEIKIIEISMTTKILTPSNGDVLNENNIVEDDTSYGWGELF